MTIRSTTTPPSPYEAAPRRATPEPGARVGRSARRRRRVREALTAYLLVNPQGLGFLIVVLIPLVAVLLLLIVTVAPLIFPFLWMVSSALKPPAEIFSYLPRLIPQHVAWENLTEAFRFQPFARQIWNSVYIAAPVTALTCALSLLSGYVGAAALRRSQPVVLPAAQRLDAAGGGHPHPAVQDAARGGPGWSCSPCRSRSPDTPTRSGIHYETPKWRRTPSPRCQCFWPTCWRGARSPRASHTPTPARPPTERISWNSTATSSSWAQAVAAWPPPSRRPSRGKLSS